MPDWIHDHMNMLATITKFEPGPDGFQYVACRYCRALIQQCGLGAEVKK